MSKRGTDPRAWFVWRVKVLHEQCGEWPLAVIKASAEMHARKPGIACVDVSRVQQRGKDLHGELSVWEYHSR